MFHVVVVVVVVLGVTVHLQFWRLHSKCFKCFWAHTNGHGILLFVQPWWVLFIQMSTLAIALLLWSILLNLYLWYLYNVSRDSMILFFGKLPRQYILLLL